MLVTAAKQEITFRRLFITVLVLCSCVLLAACSGTARKVPVADRSHSSYTAKPSKPVTQGQYVVRPGDTLYSIAFRFGWDWKELAKRNDIKAPYTIRPRQVIRFSKPATVVQQPRPVTKPQAKPKAQPTAPAKPQVVAAKPPPKQAPAAASKVKGWRWPATGSVVSKFSANTSLNKGIDIAGKLGQPVIATTSGTVVYAGSGLRGYGEMIIIKHDDVYISAYGHNRRLLVNEGQQVNAGQQIAEMGSTGTDQVKLHFEIRRQGKPVDPLQYLPAR